MRIWHRITFGHRDKVESTLQTLNIKCKKSPLPGGGHLIHIDIDESDSQWPQLAALVKEKSALDVCDTEFTPEEILQAEWVRLLPTFEQGYPQPKEGMQWKRITYEGQCPRCGVGYRQKAPFRLKREPRMGKHDFLCLFWTYTLFCTPEVHEKLKVHGIRGYEIWEALLHQLDRPSRLVSQLLLPVVARPGLVDVDDLQPEVCLQCGITKLAYHNRGRMRFMHQALYPDIDMLRTHEWFGAGGHGGFREVLISNRVAKLILEEGWRGVALKPIEVI